MVDQDRALLDLLEASGPLVAATSGRLWASKDPAPGYDVADGPAVAFQVRGGAPEYPSVIFTTSYQFRVFGPTEEVARDTARLLFDALHDKRTATILEVVAETQPQPLSDPDSGWPFELVFYRVMLRNSPA